MPKPEPKPEPETTSDMAVTEAEALTKVCPIGAHRVLGAEPTSRGRGHCIGSACMVWRWIKRADAQDGKTMRGYCGLSEHP